MADESNPESIEELKDICAKAWNTRAEDKPQADKRALSYEEREDYACDVCGNVPDEDGCIEHGKGCYTQSEDGGGFSCVDFEDLVHEKETPIGKGEEHF